MTPDPSTTVELPQSHQIAISAAATVLGGAVGLLLPRIAGWALGLPWVPWRGLFELVDRIATLGWVGWALPLAGLVVGLLAGFGVVHGIARIQVSGSDIVVIKGDTRTRFSRQQVTLVQIDDGHLVLRGRADEDLIREKLEVDRTALLAAVRRYDWPTTR